MKAVLQDKLPYPVPTGKLPGIAPLQLADWLRVDEAFAGQMAQREKLIRERREEVIALDPSGAAAARELLALVLAQLRENGRYKVGARQVTRPDGVVVALDQADPLGSLGCLVQEDFCLLEKHGDEHVLTGAVLCFPASWSLREKFMKPLLQIHGPVEPYDGTMGRRVQRMLDAIRAEQPLWRANALFYDDPTLFSPRSEKDPRGPTGGDAGFFRSERQSLLRLAKSGAVVFSIHTYMLRREDIPEATR